MKAAVPFVSGSLFALGLALSGMTRPEKVIGFLDFGGAWDPSLAFVMLGAIGVHFLAQRVSRRMPTALGGEAFAAPRESLDARLVLGALLFGVGWGLSGYCPGPALVAVAGGAVPTVVTVAAMIAGVVLYQLTAGAQREPAVTPGSKARSSLRAAVDGSSPRP